MARYALEGWRGLDGALHPGFAGRAHTPAVKIYDARVSFAWDFQQKYCFELLCTSSRKSSSSGHSHAYWLC